MTHFWHYTIGKPYKWYAGLSCGILRSLTRASTRMNQWWCCISHLGHLWQRYRGYSATFIACVRCEKERY